MENYTRTLYFILHITYYFFYFHLHIYISSLLHRIFQFLQQVTSTQPYKIKHYTWPSATIIEHKMPNFTYHKFVSSLCRYDLENYDGETERSKDISNPYKSVNGVILLKTERKIKYQIKIRTHHPTLFSYHQIHTFLILWILCHQYSVTLLNEELFKIHIILSLYRTKSSLNSI